MSKTFRGPERQVLVKRKGAYYASYAVDCKTNLQAFCLFSCYFICSQWKVISTALPDDTNDRCYTAVHNGHLYLSSRSKSQGCFIVRTADLRNWQRLNVPRSSIHCRGLVSHHGNLFFLSVLQEHQDQSFDQVLFSLNETEDLASDNEAQLMRARVPCTWQRLSNGRAPAQQLCPAFFGVGHSLLLVGGKCSGSSVATVQEYCLFTGRWLEQTDWPSLPVQLQQQQPVVMDDVIHLVSGVNVSSGKIKGSATVHSMEMEAGRCRGPWKSTIVRPTPGCVPGACRLFNTVAVAGCFGSTGYTGVNFLDDKSQRWLHLPPLTCQHQQTGLVHFKGSLLAFGGADRRGHYISSVEQFPTDSVLGIAEEGSTWLWLFPSLFDQNLDRCQNAIALLLKEFMTAPFCLKKKKIFVWTDWFTQDIICLNFGRRVFTCSVTVW